MSNPDTMQEAILEQEKIGNVVVRTIEGLMVCSIDDIINQPTEGLTYDLNRDKATILTIVANSSDPDRWVNDYATNLVLCRLKEFYDKYKDRVGELDDDK